MIRNCKKQYYRAVMQEMMAMDKAGLDYDGSSVSDKIQKMTTVKMGSEEYRHIHSCLMVCSAGASVAILIKIVSEDNSVETAIVTDIFFDMMSKEAKKYIISHEEGHMVYGHGGTDADAIEAINAGETISLGERNIEAEYAADEYAARQNGKKKTLKSMHEFLRIMRKNDWTDFDAKELIQRIEHLKMAKL